MITAALKHEEIEKHPESITKIKYFINKYNWEGINFSSEKGTKIEKNNLIIVLNVLYAKHEKIYPSYVSKQNSNCYKQVIPLIMIPNGEGWHYFAEKKQLFALSRGISVIFIA